MPEKTIPNTTNLNSDSSNSPIINPSNNLSVANNTNDASALQTELGSGPVHVISNGPLNTLPTESPLGFANDPNLITPQTMATTKAPIAMSTSNNDSMWANTIMFGVMGLFLYFFMIRPQQKKAAIQQKLLTSLIPGDVVILKDGIVAVIKELLDDNYIKLLISSGTTLVVTRTAILQKTNMLADEIIRKHD